MRLQRLVQGGISMSCAEFQKQIMSFINQELEDDELDRFLAHVKACSECMEELEVYYTLITSMKQLDEDQDLSSDYRQDLINLLEKKEEHLNVKKLRHGLKRVYLVIIIGIIALTSTYRIGEFVVEDVIQRASVSNFMPEKIKLVDKDLPDEIEEELPGIFMYLRQTNKEASLTINEYYGDRIWNNMIIQKQFGQTKELPNWTVLNY